VADDVLASLRPEGGWWTTTAPAGPESPTDHARTGQPRPPRVDDERWLLACVASGHVRWRGDGTRRVATRTCAHTDAHADITDPVDDLIAAGHAERAGTPGANGGGITLTINGRRRLADLERAADG